MGPSQLTDSYIHNCKESGVVLRVFLANGITEEIHVKEGKSNSWIAINITDIFEAILNAEKIKK